MALDATKFKPVPEDILNPNYGGHGWIEHTLENNLHENQRAYVERLRNITLVVPAKMTMSTAEYVCENGVWMRLHEAQKTSDLPKCVSEKDVGRFN